MLDIRLIAWHSIDGTTTTWWWWSEEDDGRRIRTLYDTINWSTTSAMLSFHQYDDDDERISHLSHLCQ